MADVPSECVRYIASLVCANESPGNRVLYLTQLCGVCKRWRHELCGHTNLPVSFDGATDAGGAQKGSTLLKFRRSDIANKRNTLLAASKLLSGYSDVTLTGECVTDDVLLNISRANGVNLTSIKLAGVTSVSDAGLVALISSAPLLKHFVLEDTGAGVVGTFVPVILQVCRQLETLHIEGAEAFSWAQLGQTRAWWPSPQVTQEVKQAAVGDMSPGRAAASSSLVAPSGVHHREFAGASMGQQTDPQQQQQQQQSHRPSQRHHRLSSSNALSGGGVSDDDAESDDSCSSMGAASDSTSISVPAAATAALAMQLQHTVLQDSAGIQEASSSSSSRQPPPPAAALVLPGSNEQAGQQLQQQQQLQHVQLPHLYPWGIPRHQELRRLHVRFANVENLQHLIERCPGLAELQLDGPALNIQTAAACCPGLKRLAYLVSSPAELDAALLYLNGMGSLKGLELEVKGMMLSTEQLRVVGTLPLRELSLDSHAYRQQPSMPRPQYSHLDNEGIKGLVDAICSRMRNELVPLKLSLCGATALKQEAVSALLRLPILTAIDTGGCVKLTPMDRMRLVAKVKAGQGMMDSKAAGTPGGLAALRFPHHAW